MASRMYNAAQLSWGAADNKRIPGWDQVRRRLIGEDNKPLLYIFSTCIHLIRTLPALQHDEHNPEDLDTKAEDHAADALRYGCMHNQIQVFGQAAVQRILSDQIKPLFSGDKDAQRPSHR